MQRDGMETVQRLQPQPSETPGVRGAERIKRGGGNRAGPPRLTAGRHRPERHPDGNTDIPLMSSLPVSVTLSSDSGAVVHTTHARRRVSGGQALQHLRGLSFQRHRRCTMYRDRTVMV